MSDMRELDPRDIHELEFPLAGPASAKLAFLAKYAVLAPSNLNTQPWRFHLTEDPLPRLDLWADRTRALPLSDPRGRELYISCGAALEHLTLALHRFGQSASIDILPDSNLPDLVSSVTLTPGCGASAHPTTEDNLLFEAMRFRRTERCAFENWNVPVLLRRQLALEAASAGASLEFIRATTARHRLADLVAEASLRQTADPRIRSEFAQWVSPRWSKRDDGLRVVHLLNRDSIVTSAVTPIVIRNLDWGGWAARERSQSILHAPLLAVLSTSADSPEAWIAAGRALARVLLRACADGVRASFCNYPLRQEDMRAEVAELARTVGTPQVILQLGFGFGGVPTPRRVPLS
jgi:hypothetical protein